MTVAGRMKRTKTDPIRVDERLLVRLSFPIKSRKHDNRELFPFGGVNGHNLDRAAARLDGCLSFARFFRN